jgi:hypothetical protein
MSKKLEPFLKNVLGRDIEFALDENNNLYVDGKQVMTREVIQLRWVELVALCATTSAIIVQTVIAVLTYFKC